MKNKCKLKKILITGSLFIAIVSGTNILSFADNIDNFTYKNTYGKEIFSDVYESAWYYNDVKECFNLNLMSGKGERGFAPQGNITIAESITMASRVHNIYNGGDGIIKSIGSNWYDGAVEYAKDNEIIEGNEFLDYNKYVTRAELAYIFSRTLPSSELSAINDIKQIPDINETTKYKENIFSLYNAGIVKGTGSQGHFKPDDNISRAESAAIINRIVKPQNRQKFTFEDIIYKNDKYKFTLNIPRDWEGNYIVKEDDRRIQFDFVKNGIYYSHIFSIEIIDEDEYDSEYYEDSLHTYVGSNKGYVFLSIHACDPTPILLESENQTEFNMMSKMINEDFLNIIESIKFNSNN